MSVRILVGDCRDVLRSLPASSVHCCITSPPYWGLRDYGVEPSIWGGEACDHEWGDPQRTAWANSVQGEPNGRGGKNVNYRTTLKETGPFCQRCGAWRGVFGLEPTYQLYVDHGIAPCTGLHHFGGAGTTGMAADRLGRDAVLIEINPEYAEMARQRLALDAGPLFGDVRIERAPKEAAE